MDAYIKIRLYPAGKFLSFLKAESILYSVVTRSCHINRNALLFKLCLYLISKGKVEISFLHGGVKTYCTRLCTAVTRIKHYGLSIQRKRTLLGVNRDSFPAASS